MTHYVIAPPPQPSVAVADSAERYPLRRVYCVGRNYAAHAREMGKDPDREPPFFFMKPADAVVAPGTLAYPPQTADLHHEIELVVALGQGGFQVPVERALDLVWGYGVGVDLTRRDLQAIAKDAGRPWEWGKAFDDSAPCSPLVPVSRTGHPTQGRIWLAVNGTVRQQGDLKDLIWPVADIISTISASMRLFPGDLIFTGTPAGVGAIVRGDRITGGVDGVAGIEFTLA